MDEGPFRVPRPADRRSVKRPEAEQPFRQPEAFSAPSESQPVRHATAPQSPQHIVKNRRPSKRLRRPLIGLIVIIILITGGWFVFSKMQNTGTAIDTSKYQAVFFTNGQVYFGKLQTFNNDYMKLTDVYYLETQSTTGSTGVQTTTSADQSNAQLIKLGNEIHGPEDQMVIAKDQLLFYENLKPSGKVSQSILQYQKTNK